MLRTIEGSITDIESGCIAQQVNCQGAYGAGVSGVVSRKWPIVEKKYRTSCRGRTADELFGCVQDIRVSDELVVINIFSQKSYGNSRKTGIVYTDMDALIDALDAAASVHGPIHVPYGIGCGLAGGDWSEFESRVNERDIDIIAMKLP